MDADLSQDSSRSAGGRVDVVREVPVMGQAAGSVYAPVAGFLADDPAVAESTAAGHDSPTVLVSVPLSRAVLEAACLTATGPQGEDLEPVTPAQIESWSDDQIRAWAVGEALEFGTGAAMNTVADWEHPHHAAPPAGPVYDLVRDRIGRAFGFEDTLTASTPPAAEADFGDDAVAQTPLPVMEDTDDDADGWDL